MRTFPYDLSESVVPDNPDLLGGKLLAELVVCVRELGLMVLRLRDGTGVLVAVVASSHGDMYSKSARSDRG